MLIMFIIVGIVLVTTTGDVSASSMDSISGVETHKVLRKKKTPPLTKIAIIDTGLDRDLYEGLVPLCRTGHYDFINNKPEVGMDESYHGTVIANIITENLKGNYCLLIYKVFSRGLNKGNVRSLYKALKNKAKIINISTQSDPIYGNDSDSRERKLFKLAIKHKVKIFISAGNMDVEIDESPYMCLSWPACYARDIEDLIVVGEKMFLGKYLTPLTNCGKIIDVCTSAVNKYTHKGGTSFATPRVVNNYLKILESKGGANARNTVGFQRSWTSYLQKNICSQIKREDRRIRAYRRAGIKRCRKATKTELIRERKRLLQIHEAAAKRLRSR